VVDDRGTPRADDTALAYSPHLLEWDAEKVSRFWDYFSQGAEREYFSAKHANQLARELVDMAKPQGLILDVGCGNGDLLRALNKRGLPVAGVDSSPVSIEAARRALPDVPEDHLRVGTFVAIPFADASVDTVALIEVVEHVLDGDLSDLFRELARVVRPGGSLFITTPNAEDLATATTHCPECGAIFHRMQHVRSWDAEALGRSLQDFGFTPVRAKGRKLIEPSSRLTDVARTILYRVRRLHPHLLFVAKRRGQ
jgi:2-polyprenyl-3-methyl-5-hydroxy-6-metoxy-1,4-benzoquinol methylase